MFASILLISAISLSAVIIYWCVLFFIYYRGLRNVPRCPMIPVLGSIAFLGKFEDVYWDLHRWTMQYGGGKLIRGVLGFFFCVNVADPNMLEYVMTHTSTLNKGNLYSYFLPWLNRGLLTSTDDKWRMRRRLLTPAYHFKILSKFIDVFDKNTDILMDKLDTLGNGPVDIQRYISLYALDSICETAMGTKINALTKNSSDYVKATKQLTQCLVNRGTSILQQCLITYIFTPDYWRQRKCLKIVHGYTKSVIEMRRKELETSQPNKIKDQDIEDEDNAIGYKQKLNFLDILLRAELDGQRLNDEDLMEEVNTFMFEGHDTISAAMSFALYNISKHPEVQQRIINEQRLIFGSDRNRNTTLNDINEMKYLEMVIKESMRLYPSVPLISRIVSKDFTYGNLTLVEGLEIGISIYTLHRNPEIYPEPELFDPDRFSADKQAARHPFAYIPFSAGFRNCIGQKFAMLEMKLTLGKLLRNFEFIAVPEHKIILKSEIIINSSTGIVTRFRRRDW